MAKTSRSVGFLPFSSLAVWRSSSRTPDFESGIFKGERILGLDAVALKKGLGTYSHHPGARLKLHHAMRVIQ